MEITVELIFAVVTAVVTGLLGTVLKNNVVPSRFIPLQNLVIGIISSVIAVGFDLYSSIPVAVFTCIAVSMGVGDRKSTRLNSSH